MSVVNNIVQDAQHATLSCLLLPLNGYDMLLPKSLVKEVVYKPYVQTYAEENDWLIGEIDWNDYVVPLISFEQLSNQPRNSKSSYVRAVVCHVLKHNEAFPFYAIEVQSIPRPLILDSRALYEHEGMLNKLSETVSHYVKIGSKELVIPNFERLEDVLVTRTD